MATRFILGDNNWSIQEDFVLGYAINPENNFYIPREVSFTRSSDGMVVLSDGSIRRFPWNFIQNSESLDNASWIKTNVVVVPNSEIAPNGTLTADLVIPTTGMGEHNVNPAGTPLSPVTEPETISFYAKSGGLNFIGIRTNINSSWVVTQFNLSTSTVASLGAGMSNPLITSVGNGWYRCVVTISNRTANAFQFIASPAGSVSFTSDGKNGVYLWGCQVVDGSDPLVYLRTGNRADFPRIDSSFGNKCLLFEISKINLDPVSKNFNNAAWVLTNSGGVTVSTVTASNPFNLPTVSKIIPTTTLGQHRPFATLNYSAAGRMWVIAKADGYNFLSLGESGSVAGGDIIFNLSNGTVSGSAPGYTPEILSLGNGWYKCSLNVLATGSLGRFIIVRNANSTADYSGDGTSGILIAHKQYEVGTFDSSPIVSTSGSATRNSDYAFISNATQYIGNSEGTIFLHTSNVKANASGNWLVRLDDGTENNRLGLFCAASSGNLMVNISRTGTGSDIMVYSNFLTLTNQGNAKIALAYKNGDFALAVNGTIVATSNNAGAIPAFTTIRFNSNSSNGLIGDFSLRKFQTEDMRLSNAELIQLTTL